MSSLFDETFKKVGLGFDNDFEISRKPLEIIIILLNS